jgi:uncharacterized membrane protein YqhA
VYHERGQKYLFERGKGMVFVAIVGPLPVLFLASRFAGFYSGLYSLFVSRMGEVKKSF